jgi:hypothetical protein
MRKSKKGIVFYNHGANLSYSLLLLLGLCARIPFLRVGVF